MINSVRNALLHLLVFIISSYLYAGALIICYVVLDFWKCENFRMIMLELWQEELTYRLLLPVSRYLE